MIGVRIAPRARSSDLSGVGLLRGLCHQFSSAWRCKLRLLPFLAASTSEFLACPRRYLFACAAMRSASPYWPASNLGCRLLMQDVRPQPLTPEALDALQDPNLLLTRAGAFDPRLQQLDSRAVGLSAQRSSRYAIVQFDEDFVASGQDMAAWLRKQGLDVIEHLPQRAWQVRLNGASLNGLAQMAGIRFVGGTPSILRELTLHCGRPNAMTRCSARMGAMRSGSSVMTCSPMRWLC